jgi:hypothetical protein
VKVEVTTPKPSKTLVRGKRWSTTHLPEICNVNNRWRKQFIPTYIWTVSRGNNPWAIEDLNAISNLKKIWTKIYGNEKFIITTDGPVFAVVSDLFPLKIFLTSIYRPSNGFLIPGAP